MKALVYDVKPVNWLACQCLRRFWPSCVHSPLGGLGLRNAPAPALPGDDWVRVRTLMGGVCGTDLAILSLRQPANSILQAFSSMPMVLGHENVAVVEEVGPRVDKSWLGRRVCVEPTLCCAVRGIDPPCERCAAGEFGACENFGANGLGRYGLPPGTSIGYNSRTGGSWSEGFVAHVGQLVPVPDGISDELAVLTDPLACSLHAALRADLSSAGRVLVYGAGVLGLGLIASLRAVGFAGRIEALDRAAWLEGLAKGLGADSFFGLPQRPGDRFARIAEMTGASVQRSRFENYMLCGGYDVVFDCVGSRQSVEESLKWTRARGQVVLVGTAGAGADLTPIWFRELSVTGAYGRQIERIAGPAAGGAPARRIGTYQLVHEFMQAGKLKCGPMLTHTFRLNDYRQALRVATDKSAHKAIKVAFDLR